MSKRKRKRNDYVCGIAVPLVALIRQFDQPTIAKDIMVGLGDTRELGDISTMSDKSTLSDNTAPPRSSPQVSESSTP